MRILNEVTKEVVFNKHDNNHETEGEALVKVLIINGPNINFLGIREKSVYGEEGFAALLKKIEAKAKSIGIEVEMFQSNGEGEIIDRIQKAYFEEMDGLIINPGAYTHYSYAISDALASIEIPKIEVHISNVHKRENFRHTSVTAPACTGQIMGLGLEGYMCALDAIKTMIKKQK